MRIALPSSADVDDQVRRVTGGVDAAGRYLRNALRHFSGLAEAEVATTPRELVWGRDKAQLFRYESSKRRHRTPVLLVMSLVTRPTVFDLMPQNSLVHSLLEDGHDVYILDWGIPDAADAENTFETYCDEYLPRAIRRCADVSGSEDVSLLGYCLGGVMSMLTIAANPDVPVRSLVLLTTPVDFRELGPGMKMISAGQIDVDDLLDETGNVAADTLVAGFKLVQPAVDITTYNSLWHSFLDERSLYAHQAIVGWSKEQIPFPGAAMRQVCEQFLVRNELVNGTVTFAGRSVDLTSLRLPVLHLTGTRDKMVPTAASSPLPGLLAGTDLTIMEFDTGHVGMLHGRTAVKRSVPAISNWLAEHSAA